MGSLGGICKSELELPKVNLSGLDIFKLDTKAWIEAREAIAQALELNGAFEVVYDKVNTELRNTLLGLATPELFAMQIMEKLHDNTALPFHGWLLQKPGFPFLAQQIIEPYFLSAVQEYANTIWPRGNDSFCNTTWSYAEYMQELIQIIHRMILESLGLENHYDSHIKSLTYSMRLTGYNKDISNKRVGIVKPSHKDPNYVSIICQHKVNGLEVETFDGEWIRATPSSNSFTVLLGEAFMAWTNGRLKAPKHRVKMDDIGERYSVVFSTIPTSAKDMINVPKELIDEKHPLHFKAFNYYNYIKFRFSDEGEKLNDTLKSYCGV